MTTLIVLGMHRGGTSLAAGLAERLGYHMGPYQRPPDKWNPTGYFEDVEIRDINQKILQAAGGWWADPPSEEAIEYTGGYFRDKMRYLVLVHRRLDRWGWKDPRTCLTAPLWHSCVMHPKYLVVHRDPQDVVASLMSREVAKHRERPERDEDFWTNLYNVYWSRALRFLDRVKPEAHHVMYSSLVDPTKNLGAIASIYQFASGEEATAELVRSAASLVLERQEDA